MDLHRTPLHDLCITNGGRMVPFAGWDMPVQFSGLINEHTAVRQKMGLFDISHMGVLRIHGMNPKDALQTLVPTDLHRIGPGQACYSVLLNESGGIRDDLIIYDPRIDRRPWESKFDRGDQRRRAAADTAWITAAHALGTADHR